MARYNGRERDGDDDDDQDDDNNDDNDEEDDEGGDDDDGDEGDEGTKPFTTLNTAVYSEEGKINLKIKDFLIN